MSKNRRKNIVIIGASGFIGQGISDDLVNLDFNVIAVSRNRPKILLPGIEYEVIGDFMRYEGWADLLNGCFAVVMAAGLAHDKNGQEPYEKIINLNVDLPEKIAKVAADQGVSKFIFLSSVKVFGEITEVNKAFEQNSDASPSDRYALSKLQAEEKLRQLENKETEFAIIRLPLVIGKNAKGNIGLIQWLIGKRIPIPVAALNFNSRSIILMNEISEFIIKIINSKNKATGIHLIKHAKNLSTKELVQLVGALENRKPIMLYIPPIIFRIFLKAFNLRGLENQLLHNFEIKDNQRNDKTAF